jgi:hypothetical protein
VVGLRIINRPMGQELIAELNSFEWTSPRQEHARGRALKGPPRRSGDRDGIGTVVGGLAGHPGGSKSASSKNYW